MKRFAWHHESFGLFKRFAGKFILGRSVLCLIMFFLSFFFSYWPNFRFQIPVKYHYIHWFFFVISSVIRLVCPFLGVLCCCIRWGIRFHIFFGHFQRVVFLVVFRIWRSTGSFVEPLVFSTHMLRSYKDAYTARLADSSLIKFSHWITRLNVESFIFSTKYELVYIGGHFF